MNLRYYVQSEHVRGERRTYWVCDREVMARFGGGHRCVTIPVTSKFKAERECAKLNAAKK